MDEIKLDLGIFMAQSLAINPKSYKYIDKIFNKDIQKYREIAKLNKYYDSKIVNEGSIEQTYYFRKVLGLIDDPEIMFELSKCTYKYAYQYVVSNEKISLAKFFRKLKSKNKNMSLDEENGNLLNCVLLANTLGKEIIQDESYNLWFFGLNSRLNIDNSDLGVESINDLDKEDRNIIRKVELNLNRLYLKTYEPLPQVSELDKFEGEFLNLEKLSDLDKKILPYEYIYDLENISITNIVGNKYFKSEDIQELIYCWFRINGFTSLEKVNYKDLYVFIVTAIQIRYLLRAYKQAKIDYFKTFDEDLNLCLKIKDNKIESLEKENLNLKNENELLKKELELLKSKKESLEKEVTSFENSKKELIELRNYIFNQEIETVEDEIKDIDLNEINGVVFGGHTNWISKMKDILVNWTFVPTESINFDENIIKNNEYIFINTKYISHAVYYKVIKYLTNENKLRYINSINIDKSLEDIKKSIHE